MLVKILVTLISDSLNREKQLTNKKSLFLGHVALGLRGGSAGSRGLMLLSSWPSGSRAGGPECVAGKVTPFSGGAPVPHFLK